MKHIHWPEEKKKLDPHGTQAFDAIDAHEQIRNRVQHFGPDIAKHKQEIYCAPYQNCSPNVERFDRDVKYNETHRQKRLGKITTRINAEGNKAEHHHGH